jgi:hypothetical protein
MWQAQIRGEAQRAERRGGRREVAAALQSWIVRCGLAHAAGAQGTYAEYRTPSTLRCEVDRAGLAPRRREGSPTPRGVEHPGRGCSELQYPRRRGRRGVCVRMHVCVCVWGGGDIVEDRRQWSKLGAAVKERARLAPQCGPAPRSRVGSRPSIARECCTIVWRMLRGARAAAGVTFRMFRVAS